MLTSSQAAGFSSNQFLEVMLGSLVAPIVLAVLLPFAASMILDGLVLVLRGRGLRGLVVALTLTGAVAVCGVLALTAGGPQSASSFSTSASFLLPWSSALAGLAFVVRQVKGTVARRA